MVFLFALMNLTSPWDLGGDGKWAIFRIKVDWDEDYLRWLRK
jgi:hypothetical protein